MKITHIFRMIIWFIIPLVILACLPGRFRLKLGTCPEDQYAQTENGPCIADTFQIIGPAPGFDEPPTELQWTALDGALSYDVALSSQINCSSPIQEWIGLKDTTVALPKLSKGALQYVCVVANVRNSRKRAASNNPYSLSGKPIVLKLTSSSPEGFYKTGQHIDLKLRFSRPVTVTGTPSLSLAAVATSPKALYLSGSGSDELVFRYTVGYQDRSAMLDYTSTSAINLNSGSIVGIDGVQADVVLPASPGESGSISKIGTYKINQPYVSRTRLAGSGSVKCYILSSGALKCWGFNGSGQLGRNNTTTVGNSGANSMSNLQPINLGAGRTAVEVSVTDVRVCAVLDDGTAKCWGSGGAGALGQDSSNNIGDGIGPSVASTPGIFLGGGRTALSIAAGGGGPFDFSCAVLDNGDVKCWGSGPYLGQDASTDVGDNPARSMTNLRAISLGRPATKVVTGYEHACALLDNGDVKCWGDNTYGQLGQDHTTFVGDDPSRSISVIPPVNLGAGRSAVQISVGISHSCALLDNGDSKCWGSNGAGELGQNNVTNVGDHPTRSMANLQPINFNGGFKALQLSAGNQTCALLENFKVICWGWNFWGSLGQENTLNIGDDSSRALTKASPIALSGLVSEVSNGQWSFGGAQDSSCVRFVNDSVQCWGGNGWGQLGRNNTTMVGNGTNDPMSSLYNIPL